ncbi:MAG: methyltransferase [Hyphomicrobiales bacterium]|nr:methyltransferase [Hyphomicrobiales bacterium]
MLASPDFQAFARYSIFTRPIACRRANDLFDLCAGFVYSQILYACVRLKLFDQLAAGPLSADELAERLCLPPESMRLLLDAALSLNLTQLRSGNRYGLGPRGAALLGNPGVMAMIQHHAMLYEDLRDPVALLRREAGSRALAQYWPYAGTRKPADLSHDAVLPYTSLMAQSQPMIAQEVLSAYSFAAHRCLLDVGGGNGAFLSAVARKNPNLRCVLFDLPAVADQASARFHEEGLSSRAVAIGGSFLSDDLPGGADIISLVRILHDHDDEHVMTLLRAVYAALPDNGTLLIAEPLASSDGSRPVTESYFAFYLLAMGSGRPRSFVTLRDMLQRVGFAQIARRQTGMPMLTGVITAKKIMKRV